MSYRRVDGKIMVVITILSQVLKSRWLRINFGNPALLMILASTVFVVAGIWIVALERIRQDQLTAIDDEVWRNSNLAHSQKERADHSLRVLDQILLFLRAEFSSHGLLASLDARLAAIQADRRYLRAVLLINAQGEVMAATSDSASAPSINHADRDYFIHHAVDASADLTRLPVSV